MNVPQRHVFALGVILVLSGAIVFIGVGPLETLGCETRPQIHVREAPDPAGGVRYESLTQGQKTIVENAIEGDGVYTLNRSEEAVTQTEGLPHKVRYNDTTYRIDYVINECGVGLSLNDLLGGVFIGMGFLVLIGASIYRRLSGM